MSMLLGLVVEEEQEKLTGARATTKKASLFGSTGGQAVVGPERYVFEKAEPEERVKGVKKKRKKKGQIDFNRSLYCRRTNRKAWEMSFLGQNPTEEQLARDAIRAQSAIEIRASKDLDEWFDAGLKMRAERITSATTQGRLMSAHIDHRLKLPNGYAGASAACCFVAHEATGVRIWPHRIALGVDDAALNESHITLYHYMSKSSFELLGEYFCGRHTVVSPAQFIFAVADDALSRGVPGISEPCFSPLEPSQFQNGDQLLCHLFGREPEDDDVTELGEKWGDSCSFAVALSVPKSATLAIPKSELLSPDQRRLVKLKGDVLERWLAVRAKHHQQLYLRSAVDEVARRREERRIYDSLRRRALLEDVRDIITLRGRQLPEDETGQTEGGEEGGHGWRPQLFRKSNIPKAGTESQDSARDDDDSEEDDSDEEDSDDDNRDSLRSTANSARELHSVRDGRRVSVQSTCTEAALEEEARKRQAAQGTGRRKGFTMEFDAAKAAAEKEKELELLRQMKEASEAESQESVEESEDSGSADVADLELMHGDLEMLDGTVDLIRARERRLESKGSKRADEWPFMRIGAPGNHMLTYFQNVKEEEEDAEAKTGNERHWLISCLLNPASCLQLARRVNEEGGAGLKKRLSSAVTEANFGGA